MTAPRQCSFSLPGFTESTPTQAEALEATPADIESPREKHDFTRQKSRRDLGRVLFKANQVARRRNRRLLSALGAVGTSLVLAGAALVVLFLMTPSIVFYFGQSMIALGMYTMLLMVSPNDPRAVRTICVLVVILLLFGDGMAALYLRKELSNLSNKTAATLDTTANLANIGLDICAFTFGLFWLLNSLRPVLRNGKCRLRKSPRGMLISMWQLASVIYFVQGAQRIGMTSLRLADPNQTRATSAVIGSYFAGVAYWLVALLSLACLRDRIQSLLRRCVAGSSAESALQTSAAAGVAALLGGVDTEKALVRALNTFRALPASELTLEDLASSAPSPELHGKTILAETGEVDYFVSHSWRDPSESKWNALQQVLEDDPAANETRKGSSSSLLKGETLLWFDKACVNQTSITISLQSLPIHLAGCKSLLILAGPTYVTRLWTLMEVFVFVHAGGSISRIKVAPLGEVAERNASWDPGGWRDELRATSKRRVRTRFGAIDVRAARCSDQEVRQQLLAIVESAFGDMRSFNTLVGGLLTSAVNKDGTRRRRPSLGEDSISRPRRPSFTGGMPSRASQLAKV